ncbi:MAG: ROK family protein [Bryobacteraceae bacterium]
MNTLAIDIGGTKFALALFEGERISLRLTRPTDREAGREWMLSQLEPLLRAWKSQLGIDRCAVGFGGPVDFPSQRVALSTHASGWENFPLVDHLKGLLDVPVIMDNDANTGALGEAVYGTARAAAQQPAARPLFYMTLSTGIGGGIVLEDDSIYRGADSYAGEIGHLNVRPDGPACLCGSNGCLERMCGGIWLERDYGMPAPELFEDGDFVARYVVDLARGLKAAIMLLNPAKIVIGGGISRAGGRLFTPLREELHKQVPGWSRARIEVLPAALGTDSVLWGALALAKTLG